MDININKKEQFAKYRAYLSEKISDLSLGPLKFIKKSTYDIMKNKESDLLITPK